MELDFPSRTETGDPAGRDRTEIHGYISQPDGDGSRSQEQDGSVGNILLFYGNDMGTCYQ